MKDLQALGEETIPPPAAPIWSSKVQALKQDFGGSGLKECRVPTLIRLTACALLISLARRLRSAKPA